MGTNNSGASFNDVNSTIGPSAPPTIAIAAACLTVNHFVAIGRVTNVPSSANRAMIMLVKGRAKMKPMSSSEPTPMNTRHAIKPLLNVNV